MNIYKRWMIVIFFLSFSFLSKDMMLYAQNIADNSFIADNSVQVALNLEDEINARYSFGFSSNEIKSLYDEVEDISSRGVELSVSEDKKEVTLGDQKVYIWWKVLSSKPFVMKISICIQDQKEGTFRLYMMISIVIMKNLGKSKKLKNNG